MWIQSEHRLLSLAFTLQSGGPQGLHRILSLLSQLRPSPDWGRDGVNIASGGLEWPGHFALLLNKALVSLCQGWGEAEQWQLRRGHWEHMA